LQVQLANALPYDLEETDSHLSTVIFYRVCDMQADRSDGYGMEP